MNHNTMVSCAEPYESSHICSAVKLTYVFIHVSLSVSQHKNARVLQREYTHMPSAQGAAQIFSLHCCTEPDHRKWRVLTSCQRSNNTATASIQTKTINKKRRHVEKSSKKKVPLSAELSELIYISTTHKSHSP